MKTRLFLDVLSAGLCFALPEAEHKSQVGQGHVPQRRQERHYPPASAVGGMNTAWIGMFRRFLMAVVLAMTVTVASAGDVEVALDLCHFACNLSVEQLDALLASPDWKVQASYGPFGQRASRSPGECSTPTQ